MEAPEVAPFDVLLEAFDRARPGVDGSVVASLSVAALMRNTIVPRNSVFPVACLNLHEAFANERRPVLVRLRQGFGTLHFVELLQRFAEKGRRIFGLLSLPCGIEAESKLDPGGDVVGIKLRRVAANGELAVAVEKGRKGFRPAAMILTIERTYRLRKGNNGRYNLSLMAPHEMRGSHIVTWIVRICVPLPTQTTFARLPSELLNASTYSAAVLPHSSLGFAITSRGGPEEPPTWD